MTLSPFILFTYFLLLCGVACECLRGLEFEGYQELEDYFSFI